MTKELPCSRCGQDIHIPARYNASNIAALEQRVERIDEVLKELADLVNPEDPHDLGGPHISIPWVLNRFAAEDDLSKLTTQQKPTEEAMEEA